MLTNRRLEVKYVVKYDFKSCYVKGKIALRPNDSLHYTSALLIKPSPSTIRLCSPLWAHRTSGLTRVAPRAVTRFYPSYQVWILRGVLYTGHRSSSSIFMLPFILRTNIFTPTIIGSNYLWKEVGCYKVFSVLWGYLFTLASSDTIGYLHKM